MKIVRQILIAYWNFLVNFLYNFFYYFVDLFTDKQSLKRLFYTSAITFVILYFTNSLYMAALFWFGFYFGQILKIIDDKK